MFDYISVRDAAKKWCISERRVQSWMIPKLLSKPVDLRRKNSKIPSDEKNDI